MMATTMAERVKARIEAQSLSLKGAARLSIERGAPVGFNTFQRLCAGEDIVDLRVLRNVATTLGMPLVELLGEAGDAVLIPTGSIRPSPLNPRKTFDDASITEMAESLGTHGQLQPIIVRPARWIEGVEHGASPYEIVIGERRWHGAVRARLADMRAIVRDVSDAELLALAITENLQRVDMTPLDTADAFLAAKKAGHKPKDIATMAARGVRVVQEYISVATHLCDAGRDAVRNGLLSISQAIALAAERDPKQQAADVTWALDFDHGEEEIRARISKRKEAAAPLFGDDAPPAKPPKAKEWPKPNAQGVYDTARANSSEFLGHRLQVRIETLQIADNVWIGARELRHRSSFTASPLKADRTWPREGDAMRWIAQDVVNDALAMMRAAPSRMQRDELAKAIEAFIKDMGEKLPAGSERADALDKWRTRLSRAIAGDPTPRDANAPAPVLETKDMEDDEDDGGAFTNGGELPPLKPCPFCGGEAEIVEAEEAGPNALVVCCTDCQASSKVIFAAKDDPRAQLVEAWNRRVGADR